MPGEDPGDFVLADFIPAFTSPGVINIHKARVQIASKHEAFIKEQGYAIVTMARRVDDLSVQANAGKKFSAIFQFQGQVIVLCDRHIGEFLPFEIFGKRSDESCLTLRYDQLYALILKLLCEPGMVWMEMGDQQIFDLLDVNSFAFEFRPEFGERSGPAAIHQ